MNKANLKETFENISKCDFDFILQENAQYRYDMNEGSAVIIRSSGAKGVVIGAIPDSNGITSSRLVLLEDGSSLFAKEHELAHLDSPNPAKEFTSPMYEYVEGLRIVIECYTK